MKTYLHATLLALGLAAAVPFLQAQTPAPASESSAGSAASTGEAEMAADLQKLGAQTEGTGKIGRHAEIDIPKGFIFFPSQGAKEIMKRNGNLVSGSEEGWLESEAGWAVLFRFSDEGYVKDDEKSSLDADKMMAAIKDGEPSVNEARKEAGLPAQHTVGFAMPPKYNDMTKNLEWAVRFTVDGKPGEFVNLHTKLLGRKGVMTAVLLVEPEKLEEVLPEYQKSLASYRYVQGETYAEYRKGDKLATYGLTGLVVGGGIFAAAKMGWLAKFGAILAKGGKAVFAGIAVLVAAIGKFFGKIFGRRDQSQFNQ